MDLASCRGRAAFRSDTGPEKSRRRRGAGYRGHGRSRPSQGPRRKKEEAARGRGAFNIRGRETRSVFLPCPTRLLPSGQQPMVAPSSDLDRFRAYLEHSRRVSPHTVRSYVSDVAQFEAWLSARQVPGDRVTHAIIRSYLATLAVDRKETSRARKLASIKAFYRFLVREGDVASSPA